jgi:lipopolysaccharide export system protein LptC
MQSLRFYLLLLILAIFSYGISRWLEPDSPVLRSKRDNPIDYFSIDYQKKEMNEQGQLKNLLNASKLTHYAGDGTTHLEKPVMTLYNENNIPPWVIESEKGILQADGDNLLLQGKVKIQRRGNTHVSPLTILTSELNVYLPDSLAKTSKWAKITNAKNQTTGIGMKLKFKAPIRLTLLSQVKGRYEIR